MRLIVGIDPGATVGIALVDANSVTRRVETFSRRNFSFSEILAWLSDKGEPMIIATDKAKPPLLVRKVAAAFGARLWYPKEDIRAKEKHDLAKDAGGKKDHEIDALAAALQAKAQFVDTIEKVERGVVAEKQGIVKKLLITGQAANIESALEMLETRKVQRIGKERIKERGKLLTRLKKELEETRMRNRALEKELAELRVAIQEKKYGRNESAAMEKLRESSSKALAEKERAIKELEKIVEGSYVAVEVYSENMVAEDIKGRAIIVDADDDKAIRKIEMAGAAAIITDLELVTTVPLVKKRKANIQQAGKFLVVDKEQLSVREDFIEWLDAYKEKREVQ